MSNDILAWTPPERLAAVYVAVMLVTIAVLAWLAWRAKVLDDASDAANRDARYPATNHEPDVVQAVPTPEVPDLDTPAPLLGIARELRDADRSPRDTWPDRMIDGVPCHFSEPPPEAPRADDEEHF